MIQIKHEFTLEPAEESTTEDYGDDKDSKLKEKASESLDELSLVTVERTYCEWAKPYGYDPYVIFIVKIPGAYTIEKESKMDKKLREAVDSLFPGDIERHTSSEII